MRACLLFVLSVVAMACRSGAEPASNPNSVATADVNGVDGSMPVSSAGSSTRTLANPELRAIIEPANARDFYWRAKPETAFFRATDAEIASFESELVPFLRAKVPKPRFAELTPLAERAPKYLRQYVGHIDADGTRVIWGNFFCHYMGPDKDGWRKESFGVKDGGDCYFNVEFIPRDKAFKDLSINGDA